MRMIWCFCFMLMYACRRSRIYLTSRRSRQQLCWEENHMQYRRRVSIDSSILSLHHLDGTWNRVLFNYCKRHVLLYYTDLCSIRSREMCIWTKWPTSSSTKLIPCWRKDSALIYALYLGAPLLGIIIIKTKLCRIYSWLWHPRHLQRRNDNINNSSNAKVNIDIILCTFDTYRLLRYF